MTREADPTPGISDGTMEAVWSALRPAVHRIGPSRLLLIAASCAIFGLTVAVGATYFHVTQTHYASRLAEQRAHDLAIAFEQHVAGVFHRLDQALRAARRRHVEAGFEAVDDGKLGDLGILLGEELAARVHSLEIVDARGRVLVPTSADTTVDVAERPDFRSHRGRAADELHIAEPYIDASPARPLLRLTRRFDGADGRFGGIICLLYDPDHFSAFRTGTDVARSAIFSLTREDGVDLARSQLPPQGAASAGWPTRVSEGADRVAVRRAVAGFPLVVRVAIVNHDAFRAAATDAINLWVLGFVPLVVTLVLAARLLTSIDQMRRTDEALRKAEHSAGELEVLSSIVNMSGAAVVVVEGSGEILRCNAVFEGLYSVDRPAGRRTAFDSMFAEKVASLAKARPPSLLPSPINFEHLTEVAASHRHISWTFSWIVDRGGEYRYAIGTGLDVTDQKYTELALFHKAKLVTLGQMVTAIAHELNQPLNGVRLAAHNAARGLEKSGAALPRLAQKLERIQMQVTRAAAIIDNMRVFGRRPSHEPKPVDVAVAIKSTLTLLGEQLKLSGIAVERDLSPGLAAVMGHETILDQVLVNLLLNAKQAIEEATRRRPPIVGETVGHVWIRAANDAEGRNVIIRIEDTGGGVPEDIMNRIFEPFFTTKAPGAGTGLGLAISFGIVSDLGGSIVARNVRRGAEFTIRLPAALGTIGIAAE